MVEYKKIIPTDEEKLALTKLGYELKFLRYQQNKKKREIKIQELNITIASLIKIENHTDKCTDLLLLYRLSKSYGKSLSKIFEELGM